MGNILSSSASIYGNASRHPCMRAMEGLLDSIAGARGSGTYQDLVDVLKRASFLAPIGGSKPGCMFCLLAPEIMRIAKRIKTESLLQCSHRLGNGSTENLENDCCVLEELLRSIVDIHENKPRAGTSSSTVSAAALNGAHDMRIEGGNITNVSGSSNLLVFIKPKSSIGIRTMLLLSFSAFLFLFLIL